MLPIYPLRDDNLLNLNKVIIIIPLFIIIFLLFLTINIYLPDCFKLFEILLT